ncbi:hypothetical protein EZS27_034280 [termite gut metagenome]|uniref:Uncharacterized protein n=1 Tax=termite gut metagenome TaxID=433724 RepID=A0A5J4Q2F8_9ZZZZ
MKIRFPTFLTEFNWIIFMLLTVVLDKIFDFHDWHISAVFTLNLFLII